MLLKALRVAGLRACPVRVRIRATAIHLHTHCDQSRQQKTVIILTGATATGKSSAAEYLCTQHEHHNKHNYEIVVADSVQAMRYLDIGSNKPSAKELAAIPHHMVNIHDPGDYYSAGEYCQDATKVIVDILQRGKVPLVVGGNTMWVDWLIKGVPNAPKGSHEVKRQAAELLSPFMLGEAWGEEEKSVESSLWSQAFAEVGRRKEALLATCELTPELGSSVDMTVAPNDWYRLHRLLEIILTFQNESDQKPTNSNNSCSREETDVGNKSSTQVLRFRGLVQEVKVSAGISVDLRCFFLGGERISLYQSIDQRCVAMLTGGLLQEVADLFIRHHLVQLPRHTSGFAATQASSSSPSLGCSPTASAAIGYRQAINYLCRSKYKDRDVRSLMAYIDEFATATRNYAKRQLHWYRNDSNFLWIHNTSNNPIQASRRMGEEIYYWTYEVSTEQFRSNLNAQFFNAQEFAQSEEMKKLKNKTHLLKAKFNKCNKKSGESYILRSCEGALDRDALKRYTSQHTRLTASQGSALCAVADSCRRSMFGGTADQ